MAVSAFGAERRRLSAVLCGLRTVLWAVHIWIKCLGNCRGALRLAVAQWAVVRVGMPVKMTE
eukprot:355669-Chlamydomonas_euryale.AAC.5